VVSSDPVWGRLALLSGSFLSVLDEATEMVPALTGMLTVHHLKLIQLSCKYLNLLVQLRELPHGSIFQVILFHY
jgi:hypothetical protein